MAEIKSTMEMVMERAAKMAAQADENPITENQEKTGMRLAAQYLNTKEGDLAEKISKYEGQQQKEVLGGVCQTLLRNVVLPRDDEPAESCIFALQTISDLDTSGGTAQVCAELKQILEQYGQHKGQTQQQLEDALRGQLEQQAISQGQTPDPSQINPQRHPQYQEEMSKMLTELNGQYTQALDERKLIIKQQLLQ